MSQEMPNPSIKGKKDLAEFLQDAFDMRYAAWGSAMHWSNPEVFKDWKGEEDFELKVHGHKTPLPKVGDHLVSEFPTTFTKFEFIEVRPTGDPPDMFFGKVVPCDQIEKEGLRDRRNQPSAAGAPGEV